MTNEQIKRIIEGAGYKVNVRDQFFEISRVLVDNPQNINYLEDFLTFDNENSILTLKKFYYQIVSGRLSKSVIIDNETKTISSQNLIIRNGNFRFRNPLQGDKLIILRNGEIIDTGLKIIAANSSTIYLDGKLEDFDAKTDILLYADNNNFKDSSQDKLDKTVLLKYKELTKNKEDMYIDYKQIIGIEMKNPLIGNM